MPGTAGRGTAPPTPWEPFGKREQALPGPPVDPHRRAGSVWAASGARATRTEQSGDDDIAAIAGLCHFRWMMLRRCVPLLLLMPASALANTEQLCRALQDLKQNAARSGPERVAILKEAEMTFACRRTESAPAQVSFCDAAAESVGIEFTHKFPWLIHDCLRAVGIRASLETVDRYTGIMNRKKITHLWAKWRDGTQIDIRFNPTADFSPEPRFEGYWGAYGLIIWRP